MDSNLQNIFHLLARSTFGPNLEDARAFQANTIPQIVDQLVLESKPFQEIILRDKTVIKNRKKARRIGLIRRRNKNLEINHKWLMSMALSKNQLREKLAFFWHDHFAVRSKIPNQAIRYVNLIRQHALGSFKDLLLAVCKDQAMITYLNNNINRKENPNENFARELMELFTLGIGHYTESDVKEVARAFTGWTCKPDGTFVFRRIYYDKRKKTILGQTGNFNGEDVLRILIENKQTSRTIVSKLFFYFAGKKIPDEFLYTLSESFYESNYDITELVIMILTSEFFYQEEFKTNKIKSPIELIAGQIRLLDLNIKNEYILYKLQSNMGQELLNPPNVSGWTNGKHWIDLNTISDRLDLAAIFLYNKKIKLNAPILSLEGDEDEEDEEHEEATIFSKFEAIENMVQKNPEQSIHLLNALLYNKKHEHLESFLDVLKYQLHHNEITVKDLLIKLMSQPEYQMH